MAFASTSSRGFHFHESLGGFAVDLPAGCTLHAVHHREILAFPGVQVVFEMGIPGEKDVSLTVGTDLGGDFFVQLLRAGEAQGAVHKIVLIIDDKQIPVHSIPSCFLIP